VLPEPRIEKPVELVVDRLPGSEDAAGSSELVHI
jgi:hypothetical protein